MKGPLALATVLMLWPTAASGQAPLEVSISAAPPCEAPTLDSATLRDRVLLELEPRHLREPWGVEVEEACGGTTVLVVAWSGEQERRRRADLGPAEGMARVWSLALVVADMLRRPPAPGPASGLASPTVAAESPPATSSSEPEEESSAAPERPFAVEVVAESRVYLDPLTALFGGGLAGAWRWLRVEAAVLGTQVTSDGAGRVGVLSVTGEVAADPLRVRAGPLLLGLRVLVSAGAVRGRALSSLCAGACEVAWAPLVGIGGSVRAGVELGSRLELDATVGAAWELAGTTFLAGLQPVVAVRGLRLDGRLALRVAL